MQSYQCIYLMSKFTEIRSGEIGLAYTEFHTYMSNILAIEMEVERTRRQPDRFVHILNGRALKIDLNVTQPGC